MMLYELFSWMKNGQESVLYPNQAVDQTALLDEHQRARTKRRELLAAVYAAQSGPSLPSPSNDAPARLNDHHDYMDFLLFCSKTLGDKNHATMYLLALQYLLASHVDSEHHTLHASKICALFSALLQEYKEETRIFYHSHQDKLDKFPQIAIIIAAEKTREYVALLTLQLQGQENPLSIAQLLLKFVDDTERFAAAILWLLRRGVSSEQILPLNLLQHFMAYNIAYLHATDSPIQHLYRVLAQFPEAEALIKAAENVYCEERGFHTEENGTRSYAINGVLCEQRKLHHVAINIPALDFSKTEDNFTALYQVFDVSFLIAAVVWYANMEEPVWQTSLSRVLNSEDSTTAAQLPSLINTIALREDPHTLAVLSSLIADKMAEKLVSQRCGAVLHLLPFNHTVRWKMSERDIGHYLEIMRSRHAAVVEVIPQLMSILIAFQDENKAVADLVYEAILDVILQHSEYAEDRFLVKFLKKYPEKETIFAKKSAMLDAELDQCIEARLATERLDIDGYHLIEDSWLRVTRSLFVLHEIAPAFSSHCPSDKYQLQSQVMKRFFSLHPREFDVDDFMAALGLSPEFAANGVNEYERALIEMLIAMDDEAIRARILDTFEKNDHKRNQWMQTIYGVDHVFNRAIKAGNLGLIQSLESKIIPNYNEAVSLAADSKQWRVVNYFCQSKGHHLDLIDVKDLLIKAIDQGQLSTVQFICEHRLHPLASKIVDQAFIQASASGYLDVARYLLDLQGSRLGATIIAKALDRAILNNKPDLIAFIGNLPPNLILSNVVERALIYAVTHDNLPLLQQLCSLDGNPPGPKAIEKAFQKAIKFGHLAIVAFLCDLSPNGPNQAAIDVGLIDAIENRFLPIVQHLSSVSSHHPSVSAIEKGFQRSITLKCFDYAKYLCNFSHPKPRPAIIDRALQSVAKSGAFDFVRYLCEESIMQPRQTAMEQSIQSAAKAGHLAIVAYLSSRVSAKALVYTWQLAAQNGHLEVVRFCCELHPPTWKSVIYIMNKVVLNGHDDVKDYLQTFSPKTTRRQSKLSLDALLGEVDLPSQVESLRSPDSPGFPMSPSYAGHHASLVPVSPKLAHPVERLRNALSSKLEEPSAFSSEPRRLLAESRPVTITSSRPESVIKTRAPTIMQKSLSCSALGQLGFFGVRTSSGRGSVVSNLSTHFERDSSLI